MVTAQKDKNEPSETVISDNLKSILQNWLADLFAKEMRIDHSKLTHYRSFQDYGVDSVLLAQLSQSINQLVTQKLEPTLLYEYDTIESLSAWLMEKHEPSVTQFFEKKNMPSKVSEKERETVSTEPVFVSNKQDAPPVHHQPIVIVGLSCRFPGADNIDAYWDLLSKGQRMIRSVPEKRWGQKNTFYAGLLDNITHFDPAFFLLPEDDARAMDPQALLVLEETLRLFCHAGYPLEAIKGQPIGVYLGARSQHWPDETLLYQAQNPIVAVGQNYLAANLSQFFDLQGPSIVLDTACSSALVGMHMAIQALKANQITMAAVGGMSLLSTDRVHHLFAQRNLLSEEPFFISLISGLKELFRERG